MWHKYYNLFKIAFFKECRCNLYLQGARGRLTVFEVVSLSKQYLSFQIPFLCI